MMEAFVADGLVAGDASIEGLFFRPSTSDYRESTSQPETYGNENFRRIIQRKLGLCVELFLPYST